MPHIFHKILNDRQYIFCEYYVFGLPLNEYMLSKYGGEIYSKKSLGNYRPLEYRKEDNALKYCFDNATGSYYKAYGCSYKVAKACANRLLKDPRIRREITFMYEFIKRTANSRYEAKGKYISPDTNIYDIKNNKEHRDKFIKAWHLEDLVP